MASDSGNQCNLSEETYTILMQDDENMRARINALVNQINENRVKIKELHADIAIKFGEIVLFRNKLDEMSEHYNHLISTSLKKRDELFKIIEKATKSFRE